MSSESEEESPPHSRKYIRAFHSIDNEDVHVSKNSADYHIILRTKNNTNPLSLLVS